MKAVDMIAFVPQNFVAQGNQVVSAGTSTFKLKSNGLTVTEHWGKFFLFDAAGKVVKYNTSTDHSEAVAAMQGKPL